MDLIHNDKDCETGYLEFACCLKETLIKYYT